ncbi:pyridoxal-phosphate dependent enzyme [Aminiphilus sp.]|uniref:pyridoxal-phosphate dependent enzyme n=1 Tax=Aminiphilus sp. TaxID=1872488 RepID=UPI002635ECA9|nr:pyridoxal-phosphate dependent enzyme [Aminiphilus sp.]
MELHCTTPTVESKPLSQRTGRSVFLKMECFQNAGSYKIRGIGRLCSESVAAGKTHLVSSSGGNAGYAVAYAGRRLGVPVTVVVPVTTSEVARERIASEGARVIAAGDVWDDAERHALELAREEGCAYIPPFDHPSLWKGYTTLVDELAVQMDKPDALVLSVGGGGLLSGVVEGLHKHGWNDVPVVAVETEGAASFASSLQAGHLVRLERIHTIAATLAVRQVTPRALEVNALHPVRSCTVSDATTVRACLAFADDHRVLVEPACGASLSVLYDNAPVLEDARRVLVVVCGGTGVSLRILSDWERRFCTDSVPASAKELVPCA